VHRHDRDVLGVEQQQEGPERGALARARVGARGAAGRRVGAAAAVRGRDDLRVEGRDSGGGGRGRSKANP
jgi:hypothetical protein